MLKSTGSDFQSSVEELCGRSAVTLCHREKRSLRGDTRMVNSILTPFAMPGMVGAMITHLNCVRRMKDDDGLIRTLTEETETERMHLMPFIEITKPPSEHV